MIAKTMKTLALFNDPVFNKWQYTLSFLWRRRVATFTFTMSSSRLMHLSMLSRWGEAGHRRGFDVTSLPVVGTFDHSPSPGGRNFWLQPLIAWALPTPSWISAILDDREWLKTNCTELEENNVPAGCAWDSQKFGVELNGLNIVADIL